MVTLEQIKLLEAKITRAINFVNQVTEENNQLKKRNDELEGIITALREEKTRVEEGIVSALGKLNQFEDAIEKSLSSVKNNPRPEQKTKPVLPSANSAVPSANSAVPSAYTINENIEEEPEVLDETEVLNEIEDSGEAELDIF